MGTCGAIVIVRAAYFVHVGERIAQGRVATGSRVVTGSPAAHDAVPEDFVRIVRIRISKSGLSVS